MALPQLPTFGQVAQKATQTTRQTAQAVAKKVAQEHLEVLKNAKAQVGLPSSERPAGDEDFEFDDVESTASSQPSPNFEQMKAESRAQSQRLLQALETELADIRRRREEAEKQRLQQIEQAKMQTNQTQSSLAEIPQAKKKGGMMGSMKQKIQSFTSKISSKRERQKNVSG